ncbi:MAG: ComEC/Rec2 family competence protein [Campylobacterota bacterium]|nr:ComEC/Rec2 family competence protein [Campylobacterota bacterium]
MKFEKPKLFPSVKVFTWVMVFLWLFIALRILFKYDAYQEFKAKPFYFTEAKVLNSYEKSKKNRRYQVLKLKSKEGLTFYTTTHQKESMADHILRLKVIPGASLYFKDYLGTFYIQSRISSKTVQPKNYRDTLVEKIVSQHKEKSLQSFYSAIFFATPLDKALREKISLLGVSHLVALSGFHLGILWGVVYGLLLFIYNPLQQKFFPYRYALLDVGFVAIAFLGFYVWFVDYPPSLLRSYAMVLVGWIVLLMGIELLSFTFLFTILTLLILLFPSLVVSLSFWLSIAGVAYIFLLLQYTKSYSKLSITFFVIPLGIFLFMQPIVHAVFAVTSCYQLLSPLLSLLFVPFYPLAMLLHLLGFGMLFDTALGWLFALPEGSIHKLLPLWMLAFYIALSLGAIWSKKVFYLLLGIATLYGVYLFYM